MFRTSPWAPERLPGVFGPEVGNRGRPGIERRVEAAEAEALIVRYPSAGL